MNGFESGAVRLQFTPGQPARVSRHDMLDGFSVAGQQGALLSLLVNRASSDSGIVISPEGERVAPRRSRWMNPNRVNESTPKARAASWTESWDSFPPFNVCPSSIRQ